MLENVESKNTKKGLVEITGDKHENNKKIQLL